MFAREPRAFQRGEFLSVIGTGVLCAAYPAVAATVSDRPGGRIVLPGGADYDAARREQNARLDLTPDVIAYCQTPDDVAKTVRWATARDKPIAIRSGGHDYEGFSLNNHGVVIDVSDYDDIELHADGRRATIGAGATLGDIYRELAKANRTLPGGTCPSVGIAGLTTGGGYGMLVRSSGLTCDRLRRVTLIDHDGQARDSSTDIRGDDILWAVRGAGGGSFGVVTDFEFETITCPSQVVYFTMRWKWDRSTIATVLSRWMAWTNDNRRDLTSGLTLQNGAGRTVHLTGQFLGDEREMSQLIAALSKGTTPTQTVVASMSYADAVKAFAGSSSPRQSWKNKSSFGSDPMSSQAITDAIDLLDAAPHSVTCVLSFDSFGGATNDIARDRTAFPHRGMSYLLQYQTYWGRPDAADSAYEWVRSAFAALDPHTTRRSYRNYADLDLKDWQRRYFADNYPRLQSIKRALDPNDVFRFPQSIEL
jgi:FAD/FMN-containing dehydrogenase